MLKAKGIQIKSILSTLSAPVGDPKTVVVIIFLQKFLEKIPIRCHLGELVP